MENQQAQVNMMIMLEQMLQEQRAMSKVAAVEQHVQRHGQYDGKELLTGLHDRDARVWYLRGLQVLSFNHVATGGLQGSIHKIRQEHPTWTTFKEALKLVYSIEDTCKATRRGFGDLVEAPKRGLKVLEVFMDFNSLCIFKRYSKGYILRYFNLEYSRDILKYILKISNLRTCINM